jgi:oligopeptide/dipeptide ABC transporter ATP-binding protein
MIRQVGLLPEHLSRYPHEFSGGQRQRIGIARAMIMEPELVIADEPISALDVSVRAQVLNLMKKFQRQQGITYLFVAHDLSVVRYISDRIAVMYLGKIVEWGRADEVFENPRHPYTMALVSAAPSVRETTQEKILLHGQLPSPSSPPHGCPFHTRCFYAHECCERVPAPIVEVENGHFCACHFAEIPTQEKRERAKKNAEKRE